LGSLSLSPGRHWCINENESLGGKPSRSYWKFVLMSAKDKERLGKGLSNTDRYWVMRAELVNAQISHDESQPRGKIFIYVSLIQSLNGYV
jgi:hypothetical protein